MSLALYSSACIPSCQRFYLFGRNKVEVTVDSVLQGGSGYCKFEGGTLVGFCQQAVDDTTEKESPPPTRSTIGLMS